MNEMTPSQRRWLLLLALIAGVLALDLVSKQAIIDTLVRGETREPIPALVPYFQITLSYNSGAAFGILPQASDVFLVIAIVVVIGLMIFYPRLPEPAHLSRMALGMIIGGALGNAIDRIQHGHVIDFIHYRVPTLDISNVSNIADHAIVLGVIIMFIDSWLVERHEKRAEAAAAEAPPPNITGNSPSDEQIDV